MTLLPIAFWSVCGAALLVSLVTDLRERRVLDVVTYPAWALLLLLRVIGEGVGDAERGLVSGLLGSACAGGIFSFFALRKRMGWGDVKLVAVVGAAFGWPSIVAALVFISLVGAAQAVLSLLLTGQTLPWLQESARRIASRFRRGPKVEATSPRHIPYAVAIALGSAVALWWDSGV